MFNNKQHKILYVKKHTWNTIYKTIKHRAITNNEKLYKFLKKLIENLKQIFDKKTKCLKQLINFLVYISYK